MRIKLVENECLLSSPNKLVDLLNLENMINNFLNDNLNQLIADYLDNNLSSEVSAYLDDNLSGQVDTYLNNNLSTSVDNYLDDNLSQDVELYLNDNLEDKMDTYVTENNIATTSDIDKPVVLYETDGTTGLLGINAATLTNLWQLENMDFTPYKLLKCYFKMSDYSQTSNYLTPSLVIDLPLDEASLPKSANDTNVVGAAPVPCDIYLGGGCSCNPNDQNTRYHILVAVDNTKTKFLVVCLNSLYGTAKGDRNTNGRYLYKIEGIK